ncbi:MAG: hypothetical protein Tsb002_33540 [Wenzhouxiangellaceae bacterium]
MSEQELRNALLELCRAKPIMKEITADDDFFDYGASSLTIVDIQLDIEGQVGVSVDTTILMSQPTVNGWVEIYLGELARKESAA